MIEALPRFTIVRPQTVEQAVAAAQSEPTSRFLGGGTDLIVNMRRGLVDTNSIIDLTDIEELRHISCDGNRLHIGAGVTLREISAHDGIRSKFRSIAQAGDVIAGPTHRTVATVGGNLCLDTRCIYYNQSSWWRDANSYCLKYRGDTCHVAPQGNKCRAAFCGDLAPALLVHDAEVELAGPEGRRRMPLAEFYNEDGANFLHLTPGEIVIAVHVAPLRTDAIAVSTYEKVRIRKAIDFPLAGVAVSCNLSSDGVIGLRGAVTGTNSRPFILDGIGSIGPEQDLDTEMDTLEKLVQRQVSPQRTTIAAAHYRRLAVAAMTRKLANQLIDELRTPTH